jgi:hypothetical protein
LDGEKKNLFFEKFCYTIPIFFYIPYMDDIIKKLKKAWVSSDMIEKLQSWFWKKFESEIMTHGLKAAAAKLGIDDATLPDIDFKNAVEAVEELTKKDLNKDGKIGDGDFKTWVTEAFENVKEAIGNTDLSGAKKYVAKTTDTLVSKFKKFFKK